MAISIQLGAILAALLIINIYFMSAKKYELIFSICIILLTFVSKEENGIISGVPYDTGGVINPSIVGYDVLIILILSLALRHGKIKSLGVFWRRAVICTWLTITIRFVIDGFGVLSNKVFDSYLMPMAYALLMIRYLDKEKAIKVVKVLYVCVLINAAVGGCEYFLGRSLLFHEYYMKAVGWYPNTYLAQKYGVSFRCTAFLGHPLTNGMYYLMGVVYLFNNEKKWNLFKIVQFAVLGFAIFATNSRGALLILSIYILFYLISNKKALKLCFLAGMGVVITTRINLQEIYNNIFARDATGSSMMVRVKVLLNFFDIPIQNVIMGMGYNNAGTIFSKYTGGANAEISYIILLMENGIAGFISWFVALSSIYNNKMCRMFNGIKYSGLVHGMLICFLMYAATSNSFADPGTLTYLLCFILALSRIGKVDTFKENLIYGNGMESKEANSRLPV
ncbi:O-antigen ligase family protein [Gemmiger qucibialis]|uniref:O-antigen ligase family protein n=1 Tax=Gemmiger qucibialis TaxID=2997294 RepID=UPI0022DFCF56|nr:O-antigen ligase family protein [Gemmiger qucibialis]